jgi:hypothetical protein
MTRIPTHDRDMIEKVIYLPMLLTLLNKDMTIIKKSPFKIKKPYEELIEETMNIIHKDLQQVRRYLHHNNIKVERLKSDDAFTMYIFFYKGYEEQHNYFNPRLRNKVEELLRFYLKKRYSQKQTEPQV